MTSPRVVIVGSGPIGAAYARIVLEGLPTAEVVMIDSGPRLTDPPGVNVRNIADRSEQDAARLASQGPQSGAGLGSGIPLQVEGTLTARQGTHLIDFGGPGTGHAKGMPAAAVSTNVGGQGAHWTCATPRPHESERVDFIGDEEWEDLVTTAERLLHVTHAPFAHSTVGRAIREAVGRALDPDLPVDRRVRILPAAVNARPDGQIVWTGVDTVLGPLLDQRNPLSRRFTLLPLTLVRRVFHEGSRATGVEVLDRTTGESRTERADVVVVAADAIRTPQLLWASGIRPEALGRYLTEHPTVFGIVALSPEVVRAAAPDGIPAGERIVTAAGDPISTVNYVPFSEAAHPFSAQLMHLETCPVPLPEGHPLGDSEHGYVMVGWSLRKFPRVEDGLTFSAEEWDAFGMPAVTIDYELTGREDEEVRRASGFQHRAAAALGEFVPGGEPKLLPNGSSLHYQGTVRAGAADDGTSVTDPWLRVWGFDNLFVGGNGTIPTATACNPTLFSTSLAVRGARAVIAYAASLAG